VKLKINHISHLIELGFLNSVSNSHFRNINKMENIKGCDVLMQTTASSEA
jgi:hypothetical protein